MEEFFKDKKGFWWSLLYQAFLTFSNKPSFFSSKRIERVVMFNVAMWIIVGYTVRNWFDLTTSDVSILTGILLAGGAWNQVQIRRDIKAGVGGGMSTETSTETVTDTNNGTGSGSTTTSTTANTVQAG